MELKENSLIKEISFANFLIIVRAVSYAALTFALSFLQNADHVPVTHWTVTFFSWSNWLPEYSYGNSISTKGWLEEETPILKELIHSQYIFTLFFPECRVSHHSGPLHHHAGGLQEELLPWKCNFSLQRRYNFLTCFWYFSQRRFCSLT